MKALAEQIRASRRILMSTHKDPDGDGIGGILALAHALQDAGHSTDVLLPDACPVRFRFLDEKEQLRWLPDDATELPVERPDLALIIDTHQWSLLGRVGELIRAQGIPTAFLDHHPVRDPSRTDVHGDPNASSTGELVYRLLLKFLDLPIDARIGTCLYTSIAFDTHSFRYVRNSPSPHLIAADLLSRGVDANRIYRHLFASNPLGKMRLLGLVYRAVKIEENGLLAWVALPQEWIREHGVCEDDLRDAVNCLLEVEGVEVAVMLKEVQPRTIKISIRSKGRIEIHEAAQRLGGGGHPFAAGATFHGDLDTSGRQVLGEIVPLLHNGKPPSRD